MVRKSGKNRENYEENQGISELSYSQYIVTMSLTMFRMYYYKLLRKAYQVLKSKIYFVLCEGDRECPTN